MPYLLCPGFRGRAFSCRALREMPPRRAGCGQKALKINGCRPEERPNYKAAFLPEGSCGKEEAAKEQRTKSKKERAGAGLNRRACSYGWFGKLQGESGDDNFRRLFQRRQAPPTAMPEQSIGPRMDTSTPRRFQKSGNEGEISPCA